MRWVGHLVRMIEGCNAFRVQENLDERDHSECLHVRRQYIIKVNIKVIRLVIVV